VHHGTSQHALGAFIVWVVIFAGCATVHAERLLYSFSGRVGFIDDPEGALARSNYYRTGDVVSASFIVDPSSSGYRILNDGTSVLMPGNEPRPGVVERYFYCRLVSGPRMPDLHSERASHPKAARHHLYGYNEFHFVIDPFSVLHSATLMGGSTTSSFEISNRHSRDGFIREWYEGLEVVGVATAVSDTGLATAIMDMRLDSIAPAPNLHAPEPLPSVPQAINIPGLIESIPHHRYFLLSGRTPYTRVRLNASPSTDGDGDPVEFYWSGFEGVAYGEAPVVNLRSGTQRLRLQATDGLYLVRHDMTLIIYTPAQATDVMRNAIRAMPGSASAKTAALVLLQNAKSNFQRADWRRGVQFLQGFEQFVTKSAYGIPPAKRTPFIRLSRAIRGAIAQPLVSVDSGANGSGAPGDSGVVDWSVSPW